MRPRDLADRHFLARLGVVAAALCVLGALVVVSGVVPIKASSGHWPTTRWFLQFAKQRSVSTHALGVRAPELGDPALVLKGAGHYESGCKPCHGAPGEQRSGVARESAPEPPWLPERVGRWEDAELFHIVKHGIKFTGMPAWPALERDDEVWSMVAFLRALPELDAAAYGRLALGEAAPEVAEGALAGMGDPPLPPVEGCVRCHGRAGAGRGEGAFPRLAGQSPEYLEDALAAYADGRRRSGIMQPVAAGLDRGTRRELAVYYGSGAGGAPSGAAAGAAGSDSAPQASTPQASAADTGVAAAGSGGAPQASAPDTDAASAPEGGPPAPTDPLPRPRSAPAILALGEAIARQGVPERKIPSCVHCHGPGSRERNPHYPRLTGQHPAYLALQLRLFKEERRGGSAFHPIMHEVARNMTPEQMEAVALWYGSLPPFPGT